MEQRALIDAGGVQVFDDKRAGGERAGDAGCGHACAVVDRAPLLGPYGRQMAFARAFRATRSMIRFGQSGQLSISERAAAFAGLREIIAREAFGVRQCQCKLTRLNATCHAVTPCRRSGEFVARCALTGFDRAHVPHPLTR